MTIRVNHKEVVASLDSFEDSLIFNITRNHAKSMNKIVADTVAYIDKHDLISQGDLRSSITSEVDRRIDEIVGEVGTNQKHAIFVHEGTAPHWPPVQAMEEWVTQQVRRGTLDTDDIRSTAFLVGRAISKRGTKANPFFTVSLRLNRNVIINQVARAIQKAKPKN